MTSSHQHLSDAFAMLGHPTKLRLFKHLLSKVHDQDYPRVPTMVATDLDMKPSIAAYSMKRMHMVGILTRHATGKFTFYGIDPIFLKLVKEFFDEG